MPCGSVGSKSRRSRHGRLRGHLAARHRARPLQPRPRAQPGAGVGHEAISALMMTRINEAFHGELDLAIQIFNNHHPKAFLHQLVSSELDMDRLDYLSRDSFYSGVAEGKVGADRIIKMLNVVDGRLVVEEKGIYSIEKFVVARRLMYWQVYLHHTVLAAEYMLTRCLQRARDLALQGATVFATPALHVFLYERLDQARFLADPEILERFSELDDSDVLAALKAWQHHPDRVLSTLSRAIVSRQLFHIELRATPFSEAERAAAVDRVQSVLGLSPEEARYFVIHDRVGSKPYQPGGIMIRFKDGRVQDFAQASDHLDAASLFRSVEKSFLGYPKSCRPR